jgi:hypothetical protein
VLRSLEDLERYRVSATDGDVGSVVNSLLDDERWTVRYLVVEAGGVLGRPPVLISPIFFCQIDRATHCFSLALTVEKVKNGPGLDTDKPVSRQHERDYYSYYGYPYNWGLLVTVGAGCFGRLAGCRQ